MLTAELKVVGEAPEDCWTIPALRFFWPSGACTRPEVWGALCCEGGQLYRNTA